MLQCILYRLAQLFSPSIPHVVSYDEKPGPNSSTEIEATRDENEKMLNSVRNIVEGNSISDYRGVHNFYVW